MPDASGYRWTRSRTAMLGTALYLGSRYLGQGIARGLDDQDR